MPKPDDLKLSHIVMVRMTHFHRRKLDAIAKQMSREQGMRVAPSQAVRQMINEYQTRRG